MKRLMLLRHAKSLLAEAGQPDRSRGLSHRGYRDARAIGRLFVDLQPFPDLVLCSSALRTRETLAAILPHLDGDTVIRVADALYDTDAPSYMDLLAEIAGGAQTVLVIGHNPSIHATAARLVGRGPRDLLARMAGKFPTGALAAIEFEADGMPTENSGKLTTFVRPSDIADTTAEA